jgi:hypothetical protein
MTMSHLCLLGVATLTLTSASFAGSDTNADLQARLEAAETRISELSAATNVNWLNDARADEIRGLVHDVLADADTRASLQGSGATAGYNNGFTVGSADGNWSMTINGLLQTRWTTVDNEAALAPSDGSQWNFNNERSWLHFSGTIAGDYGYDIRHGLGGTAPNGTTTNGDDWANGSMAIGDWNLTMGSMKLASSREALIGDQNQLALSRDGGTLGSLIGVLSPSGYAVGQGAMLSYDSDNIGFDFQLFNNMAVAAPGNNLSGYTWNARVEYLVEGNWSQFGGFTSADGGAAGTLVGLSYMGSSNDDAAAPVGNEDENMWTLDCQMQFGGSNLYVSYSDYSDSNTAGVANTDLNELQVAYGIYLDSDWELYGRYIDNDGSAAATLDGSIMSLGVNNYLAGQNAKWTTEITWNDSAVGPNTDVTTISTQLQFYF